MLDGAVFVQPAAIKTYLDKVLSTPEDKLADVLESFTWKVDKVCLRRVSVAYHAFAPVMSSISLFHTCA